MRLSTAIRLGSLLKPQGFGVPMFRKNQNTSCAIEAGKEAAGLHPESLPCYTWPWLNEDAVCPVCRGETHYGAVIARHLNDAHLWTRGQIANWVESVEPVESAEQPTIVAEAEAIHV